MYYVICKNNKEDKKEIIKLHILLINYLSYKYYIKKYFINKNIVHALVSINIIWDKITSPRKSYARAKDQKEIKYLLR